MTIQQGIELIAALMLPIGFIGVMINRTHSGKGLSARAIQLLAVTMLIPVILILAMEQILKDNTVGTLIGALTGYLLSGISNYDAKGNEKPKTKPKASTGPEKT